MNTQVQFKLTDKITQEHIDILLELSKRDALTAENLLEEAKKKRSPFHKFFDWNDEAAAESWRLHQSRLLINEVKVTILEKEVYAFENVSVVIEEGSLQTERQYKPVYEISQNPLQKDQLLNRALRELSYWRNKYNYLEELSEIFAVIDKKTKQ